MKMNNFDQQINFVYNFETSQSLTQSQLQKLNLLLENFFMEEEDDNLVPEWTTEIELQNKAN